MGRQYVHLSSDIDTAFVVAKRITNNPVTLFIDCDRAYRQGIVFYKELTGIWLSDSVPSRYITILNSIVFKTIFYE